MKVLKVLKAASEDLLFPSETDAPFIIYSRADCDLSGVSFAKSAVVKTMPLCDFFQRVMQIEDWHNAEEIKTASDFRALVQIIQILIPDAQVYCSGEKFKNCYIIGTVGEGVGGLETVVVET